MTQPASRPTAPILTTLGTWASLAERRGKMMAVAMAAWMVAWDP